MKKVSTVSARQIKNLSQQSLTIGLDLGDRSSHYCVLDETGRILVGKSCYGPMRSRGCSGRYRRAA